MSRTRAFEYTRQVVMVLNLTWLKQTIKLPSTKAGWEEVSSGFEQICGVPNVCGAIDGSLFQVKRFQDFEGWYCRKGFPALNMQAVVDHQKR